MPSRIWIHGVVSVAVVALNLSGVRTEMWRGIFVVPEDRCSSYSQDDYRYPRSVEDAIVKEIGEIYSPYTRDCFSSARLTDIEHIVARSEAHDSGLCEATEDIRKVFSRDLLNLTLASPSLNRAKGALDAADWMPDENPCWFANRIVQVRRKYHLTIDRREADALEGVLSECKSKAMEVSPCPPSEDDAPTESAESGP